MKMYNNGENNSDLEGQGPENSSSKIGLNDGLCELNIDGTTNTLSEADIAGLIYMIEEEKMAMDLYDSFADQYDTTSGHFRV